MRSALAPVLFSVPWVLAAACGDSATPQAQAPIVVTPSASAPAGEIPPEPAPTASAAPVASASASASASTGASPATAPPASVDAGAAVASGKKIPSLRQGKTEVTGKLPPEVIQRIVRQNFGRFRSCYEGGLKQDPTLAGRVTTELVIDRSGAVTTSRDSGSDMPDANVVSCVVQGFRKLAFPQPEGGTVTVVYPIVFTLTDAPSPPAAGAGGIGLAGVVEGGGGRGEGIGLGTIGTLGHGAGGGTGQGFGHAPGGGSTPSIRQGVTSVDGRLPQEVIQRIVRQNFGRFRLCYENGLRKSHTLRGRVTVKFVIDAAGAVSDAKDGGSDLPDGGVVACVVRGFGNLSFPKPEGGVVTVVYPVLFEPGDPPAPAPSSSSKK
jgi:hypothetical protein